MLGFWLMAIVTLNSFHLYDTFILSLKTTNGSLDVEHLVGHMTLLDQTITGFQQTLKSQDADIVALQTEVANLKANQRVISGHGSDIATLKNEMLNLKANQQVISGHGTAIASLKTEIVNLKANQQRLDTKISDLQKQVQPGQISAEVTSLKNEVNTAKTEVTLMSSKVISLTSKFSNLTHDYHTLSSKVKKEANATKTKVTQVSNEVISLTSKFSNLTQDYHALSSQVKNEVNAAQTEVTQVSNEVISLTSKFSNLTQDYQTLSSQVKNEVNAAQTEITQVSNEVISLTLEFSNLTQDYQTLSSLVKFNQNLTRTVQAVQDTLRRVLSQVQKAENGRLLLHKTIAELSNNSTAATTRLSAEIALLKTEVGFNIWMETIVNVTSSSETTLKFKDIKYNKGDGYDATTGVFTAPVSGTYLFWTQVRKGSGSKFNLDLMKGNSYIGHAFTPTKGTVTESVITTAVVKAGEQVYVNVHGPDSVYCCHYSRFGGALLYRH